MKTCTKCDFTGEEILFAKAANLCKSCIKKYKQSYIANNKNKIAAAKKKHYEANKQKISDKSKVYYENNKEVISERAKEYYCNNRENTIERVAQYATDNKGKIQEYQKAYREEHKLETASYKREYAKCRRKNDQIYRLKCVISNSVYKYLAEYNLSKNNLSILDHLPFELGNLKIHIESLFEPWMTWESWGMFDPKTWDDNDQSTWTWQLDHIVPHSTFKYASMEDDEFKRCWSLDNLRPYSAKQNCIDGATRIRHREHETVLAKEKGSE
jgi:hypothetical protein